MAINFKEINDKLQLSPLSSAELSMISLVEKHIDNEIIRQFKGGPINIVLSIANFDKDITCSVYHNLAEPRRKLMFDELKSRYNDSGWKITENIGDSRERYSQDYLVLTGKK